MPLVIQNTSLKDSLAAEELSELNRFFDEQLVPAAERVEGIRSVRAYVGGDGGYVELFEMDDFSAWDRLLADPDVGAAAATGFDWGVPGTAEVLYDRPVVESLMTS